jgi:hypothetical protein
MLHAFKVVLDQVLLSSFLCQALLHASVACHRKLIVEWIAAGDLEDITAKEVDTIFYLP